MGYIRHHAIIITSDDDLQLKQLHQEALILFPKMTTPVMGPLVNNSHSFAIVPDGSKEGWAESTEADKNRALLTEKLSDPKYYRMRWAEVQFGDDDGHNLLTKASR